MELEKQLHDQGLLRVLWAEVAVPFDVTVLNKDLGIPREEGIRGRSAWVTGWFGEWGDCLGSKHPGLTRIRPGFGALPLIMLVKRCSCSLERTKACKAPG